MRIGVIADTHHDPVRMYVAMQRIPDAEAWLHLGDMTEDAELIEEKTGVPVYVVRGNCDAYSDVPYERVVTLGGVNIYMTHGHRWRVDFDRSALCFRAEELGCTLALYGHPHVSMVENNGRVIALNPGSPTRPRGGRKPTVAYVDIDGGDFTTGFINI